MTVRRSRTRPKLVRTCERWGTGGLTPRRSAQCGKPARGAGTGGLDAAWRSSPNAASTRLILMAAR